MTSKGLQLGGGGLSRSPAEADVGKIQAGNECANDLRISEMYSE